MNVQIKLATFTNSNGDTVETTTNETTAASSSTVFGNHKTKQMTTFNRRQASTPRALNAVLSLEERVKAFKGYPFHHLSGRKLALVKKDLLRWKQRYPFTKNGTFQKWLIAKSITEKEFLVAAYLPSRNSTCTRLASNRLSHIYKTLTAQQCESTWGSEKLSGHQGMLGLVLPLMKDTLYNIKNDISTISNDRKRASYEIHTIEQCLLRDISTEIMQIIEKTCVFELRLAKLEGRLTGATSIERYESFTDWLATTAGRKALFTKYPLLFEVVSRRLDMYRTNIVNMLTRLAADITLLQASFSTDLCINHLDGWSCCVGDSHRGGQSVVIVGFSRGNKIVYKPRTVRTDIGFNKLVEWCNANLSDLPLRTVKTVARNGYGWCEYIHYNGLESDSECKSFFTKQGRFIALFFALRAGDMHYENVICSGADPVYIDLETLFQNPSISSDGTDQDCNFWPMVVSDTLIVPATRQAGGTSGASASEDNSVWEVSALGAQPGADTGMQGLMLVEEGTDNAHFEYGRILLEETKHLPMRNGHSVNYEQYISYLKTGFQEMYELLLREKDFLLSEDGIKKLFNDVEIRIIFRPTRLYTVLVHKSLHPDFLADQLERRMFFEQLYACSSNMDVASTNLIMEAELRDMERFDIPFFSQKFDSCDVLDSNYKIVHGLKLHSPLSVSRDQLMGMDQSDLSGQLMVLDGMLGPYHKLKDPSVLRAPLAHSAPDATNDEGINIERIQLLVTELANQLMAASVKRRDDAYWMCWGVRDQGHAADPRLTGLYDGQLGIALFFAAASASTGNTEYADIARRVVHTVRKWTCDGRSGVLGLGVFNGVLGLPYTLANVGGMLGDKSMIEESINIIYNLAFKNYDDGLDVIGGSAGALLFISSLLRHVGPHSATQYNKLLNLSERFAEHLVRTAVLSKGRAGWAIPHVSQVPLTGFAHGCSGIAAALYAASFWLSNREYRTLADQAMAYEDSHFSRTYDTWEDLREGAIEPICAWCHGAIGVLLGRLLCRTLAKEAGWDVVNCRIESDIYKAIDISMRSLQERTWNEMSLCHGALGNWDVLTSIPSTMLDMRRDCGVQSRPDVLRTLLSMDISTFRCGDGFKSPIFNATASPGLMTGLSGIGYGLLRTAFPETVPSVLTLDVCNLERVDFGQPFAGVGPC